MEILESVNLAVRFLVELAALFALGYWGFQRGETEWQKYGMASIAALTAAGFWALLVAPNAPADPGTAIRVGLQILIFAAAVVALVAARQERLALVFGVAAAANGVLLYVLDQ
jgi:hypothetical protein